MRVSAQLYKARPDERVRENTIATLREWYTYAESRGLTLFSRPGKDHPEPNVPDEYLKPETFIGPSSSRPDGTTAWGVETRPSPKSHFPGGRGSNLDIVNRDESEAIRYHHAAKAEGVTIIGSAMRTLGVISIPHRLTAEMKTAGYSVRSIGHTLGVSKDTAAGWYEGSLIWFAGCLMVKPDFRAGMERKPPRMLAGDLAPRKGPGPLMLADVWGV